ncbi:hypothetical protein [Enterobacter mori]|uniref:hypothetical protein n=1 Tax=Enterobacter mori TaxID=539813 RepID=UPI0011DCFC1F|nr:hypothetical protein [Enterobacter mori]
MAIKQNNYFDKIRKEIPLVTMLVVVCYFFSYFFQVGLSFFWGYPVEYIEINLDVMLATSAAFLMIALITSHLLEGLINGGKLSFKKSLLFCCFFPLLLALYFWDTSQHLIYLEGFLNMSISLFFLLSQAVFTQQIEYVNFWSNHLASQSYQ